MSKDPKPPFFKCGQKVYFRDDRQVLRHGTIIIREVTTAWCPPAKRPSGRVDPGKVVTDSVFYWVTVRGHAGKFGLQHAQVALTKEATPRW
jgi:hypothetical protein